MQWHVITSEVSADEHSVGALLPACNHMIEVFVLTPANVGEATFFTVTAQCFVIAYKYGMIQCVAWTFSCFEHGYLYNDLGGCVYVRYCVLVHYNDNKRGTSIKWVL